MKSPISLALITGVFAIFTPAKADDELPRECVAMAMQIGTETNSSYERKSSTSLFFKPPIGLDNEFSIGCDPLPEGNRFWSVYVSWNQSASPPKEYYRIVARAGSILTGKTRWCL